MDPYHQWQKCKPVTLVSGNLNYFFRYLKDFLGVWWLTGCSVSAFPHDFVCYDRISYYSSYYSVVPVSGDVHRGSGSGRCAC